MKAQDTGRGRLEQMDIEDSGPAGRRVRAIVAGATGYSGGELCAILARHPGVSLTGVYSGERGRSAPFTTLHPSLFGAAGPDLEPFSLEKALGARPDVALLATPPESSAATAPALLAAGVKVIDLSGAFRLRAADAYPRWYGFAHPSPALLSEAVYGLTEWCGDGLAAARLVANPGCYATSVLLALKPLAGMLDARSAVVCDAAGGVSGAGRQAQEAYSFCELAGNFKAYGVGGHKHEPEMRLELGLDADAPFVFVAHLLPAVRGILSTIHVALEPGAGAEAIAAAYDRAYAGRPFVRALPEGSLPELKDVAGTPRALIGFKVVDGGRRAVIVSAIDNLLKGAASQAVQNLNALCGFREGEGLS